MKANILAVQQVIVVMFGLCRHDNENNGSVGSCLLASSGTPACLREQEASKVQQSGHIDRQRRIRNVHVGAHCCNEVGQRCRQQQTPNHTHAESCMKLCGILCCIAKSAERRLHAPQ